MEKFYPPYYNQTRPQPKGLPSQLSYGGPFFNISLSSEDLCGDPQNIKSATVVVIRPGFSTHAIVRENTYFCTSSLTRRKEYGPTICAVGVNVYVYGQHRGRYTHIARAAASTESRGHCTWSCTPICSHQRCALHRRPCHDWKWRNRRSTNATSSDVADVWLGLIYC